MMTGRMFGRAGALLCLAAVAWGAADVSARERVIRVKAAVAGDPEPQTTPVPPPPAAEIARPGAGPAAASLSVRVDHAKVIRLPEKTATVVVGNPAIADFAMQKNGVVVVTGKSYGLTNIIALDGAGTLLAESTVSVSAPSEGLIVVQRGFDRQSYACTPVCQPSVVLGDALPYFTENRGQADAHNQFATSR